MKRATCRSDAADDVELSGVVVPRWEVIRPGERCTAELVLLVCSARALKRKRQDEVEVPEDLVSLFQVNGYFVSGKSAHMIGFGHEQTLLGYDGAWSLSPPSYPSSDPAT